MPKWERFNDGTEEGYMLNFELIVVKVYQRMGEKIWRTELHGARDVQSVFTTGNLETAKINAVIFLKECLVNLSVIQK